MIITQVPCCKANGLASLFGAKKLAQRAEGRYMWTGPASIQIRPLFTVLKHELRSLFSLPDKHVVLVGELKMPGCGLCMAAYKKAALVVKTVCLHKSFSKPHPSFSLSFSLFTYLRIRPWLKSLRIPSCSLRKDGNPYSRSFTDSICNVFLYKAHAIAWTLTVTLSLTQTDVIKRLFICSQNPACLPTTILWFCRAASPSHRETLGE